ncbi:MAG: S-layer homology domain-containing protein [Candidatus Limnocylindria bacterium]
MPDLGSRRPRRRTSIGLVALLALGLLPLSAGAAGAAGPGDAHRGDVVGTFEAAERFGTAAVAPGSVGVKSSLGYTYGDGSTAIVGEILNLRSERTGNVLITVHYLDADENEIATGTTTVSLDRIARGSVAPFVLFDPAGPAGTASFLIDASPGTSTSAVAGGALDVLPAAEVVDGGFRYYEGTIANPNAFDVSGASAMITVYGTADPGATPPRALGDVIEVFAEDLGTIPAGDSVPYSFGIDTDLDASTARVAILADGYRADDTSVYITSWANYFDDLPLTTFRPDIVWLAEQRITGGCAAGRYCPDDPVTRGQMASFLSRALGLTEDKPDRFTDDTGNTHERAINRIAFEGITGGCAPTLYCPKANVKRDQMASFLSRALELTVDQADAFTDDTGNTHERAINRIAFEGITGGCGGGRYCPSDDVTRGQMAAFLRRAFQE